MSRKVCVPKISHQVVLSRLIHCVPPSRPLEDIHGGGRGRSFFADSGPDAVLALGNPNFYNAIVIIFSDKTNTMSTCPSPSNSNMSLTNEGAGLVVAAKKSQLICTSHYPMIQHRALALRMLLLCSTNFKSSIATKKLRIMSPAKA